MSKHTPGPWQLYSGKLRKEYPTQLLEVQDATGRVIVQWGAFDSADQPRTEKQANARLIAAAPDLLAACRAAYEHRLDLDVDELLREAIAKAEGIAARDLDGCGCGSGKPVTRCCGYA